MKTHNKLGLYLTNKGAIFVYGFMAIYSHSGNLPTDFINSISFEKRQLYVPFILGSYAIGHLLSFISSIVIEKYSIWLVGYPSKFLLGQNPPPFFVVNVIVRALVTLFLLPVCLAELLFNTLLSSRQVISNSLDPLLIEIIETKVCALLRISSGLTRPPKGTNLRNSNFFIFVYHYVVENSPHHLPKIQNYVALYGFLRTMTLISVFFFWASVWHVSFTNLSICKLMPMFISLSILSFTFYMAYLKFWRRFTFETLMALSVTLDVVENIDPLDNN